MINVQNWNVTYPDGTKAISDLSFHMQEGEHAALIGANGAGKSTLILSMAGVLPGTGKMVIDDIELNEKSVNEIRSRLGIVFQNPDDQLFLSTIYDDVAFGPRNQGVDEETVRFRVEDRLKLLNISHLKDRTSLKLSGGEKRLCAMATVLAMKPSVMVLDEPTAFLDPKARRNLINTLNTLPHTMLIATHDLTFAAETCEKCFVIKNGKLFAEGKTKDLLFDEKLMDEADVEAIRRF